MYRSENIKTKDGHSIAARIYPSEKGSMRVIVISPSANMEQEDYKQIAEFFQHQGFCVMTFDFRGIGDSAPSKLRNFDAGLSHWAIHDLDAALRYVRNKHLQHEIILIGHGIGGEITGLAPASQYIHRLVLVNSVLSSSRLRNWKDRVLVEILKLLINGTSYVFGYFPGKFLGILNNLPKGVVNEWINWCNNTNGLFDEFPDHNYRKLQVPLLAFSFSDDWHARKRGVRALLDYYMSACITWRHRKPVQLGLKKIGHSGFFTTVAEKKLWIPLLNWINDEKCAENDQLPIKSNLA